MAVQPRQIRVLDPLVAERIAAGEVIERPASVVKELVENALDAGATEIQVTLEEGGKVLIEVLDNGHGIPAEELGLAVRRHATSKVESLADLERLRTLGFRGEALPSIAAVAELSLLSRVRGAGAFDLRASSVPSTSDAPRAMTFGHFLNSETGTRIQARGLFSAIPARFKFLKAQAAEVSQVREWIERLALANPTVGFRLLSDGRQLVNLRPMPEVERVRAVLSDGDDYPMVTAVEDAGPIRVRVHWLQGLSAPHTRRIVQVINGRAVRDRLLQQALLSPFRQALLPGQFPAVALYVELDPSDLDVNVHPTKTEVRFLRSRDVFHVVESLVEAMIVKEGAAGFVAAPSSAPAQWQAPPLWEAAEPRAQFSSPQSPPQADRYGEDSAPPRAAPSAFPESTFTGILFNTYLMFDAREELVLVDQHAAHERVRYEKLRSRVASGGAPQPQQLLIPEAVHFASELRPELEARLPELARLGFEAELFGEEKLLFRAVPADWGTDELRTRLKNLVERVAAGSPSKIDESLFESLASAACHSAIRAGDRILPEEAQALVRDLFACEHPWNCPHGRPTVVRVPRARLEEWFQRRV